MIKNSCYAFFLTTMFLHSDHNDQLVSSKAFIVSENNDTNVAKPVGIIIEEILISKNWWAAETKTILLYCIINVIFLYMILLEIAYEYAQTKIAYKKARDKLNELIENDSNTLQSVKIDLNKKIRFKDIFYDYKFWGTLFSYIRIVGLCVDSYMSIGLILSNIKTLKLSIKKNMTISLFWIILLTALLSVAIYLILALWNGWDCVNNREDWQQLSDEVIEPLLLILYIVYDILLKVVGIEHNRNHIHSRHKYISF